MSSAMNDILLSIVFLLFFVFQFQFRKWLFNFGFFPHVWIHSRFMILGLWSLELLLLWLLCTQELRWWTRFNIMAFWSLVFLFICNFPSYGSIQFNVLNGRLGLAPGHSVAKLGTQSMNLCFLWVICLGFVGVVMTSFFKKIFLRVLVLDC